MNFKFKKDEYKNARGTHSRVVNLYCRKCKNLLAIYQKDGPGNLRRLYLDRILYPEKLINLQKKIIKKYFGMRILQLLYI